MKEESEDSKTEREIESQSERVPNTTELFVSNCVLKGVSAQVRRQSIISVDCTAEDNRKN